MMEMERKTQCLDDLSEAEQLEIVKQDGFKILDITNPSEAVQLAAVKQNGYAIGRINNPSEAAQLAAVSRRTIATQHGDVIERIHNPSEAVQLAAVEQNWVAIAHIRNPSEAAQVAAMKQDERATMCIEHPSNTVLATHLIHHPRSEYTPKIDLDRAEAILNAHCPGLGDVYMVGLSIDMSEKDLKTALAAYLANQ